MGWQRLSGVVCLRRLEVRHELLGAVMHHALPVYELPIRFTLTGLPRWRPEPRLIRIDRPLDDPAQKDTGTFEGSRRQRVDQLMKLSLGHRQIVAARAGVAIEPSRSRRETVVGREHRPPEGRPSMH